MVQVARVNCARPIHDGQRPIPLSRRTGAEYDRNWTPVLVQNTLVTDLERRIQSVLDSEMGIGISYLLGLIRFSPNIFWTGTGDQFRSYSRPILERSIGRCPSYYIHSSIAALRARVLTFPRRRLRITADCLTAVRSWEQSSRETTRGWCVG